MEKTKIHVDCPFCVDGKQNVGGVETGCPNCEGIGLLSWGACVLDSDVFPTHKILEATDPTIPLKHIGDYAY